MPRTDAHPSRLRSVASLAAVALVLLIMPAAASAASVSVSHGTLFYTASSGEANVLTIAPSGSGYRVSDSGRAGASPVHVSAGAGCSSTSSASALCSGVANLAISTGDMNDRVDTSAVALPTAVDGGSGDDDLTTGAGNDVLVGGDGSDHLDGGAGADYFSCGSGADTVIADAADHAAGDCETVIRAGATGGGDPLSGQPPAGTDTSAGGSTDSGARGGAKIPGAGAVVDAQTQVTPQGKALVRVSCPADSGGCSGTVTIAVPAGALKAAAHGRAAAAAARSKLVTLGSARFRASAGKQVVVPVTLARRGRWRVLRGHKVHCRVTVTTHTADGRTATSTSTTTLAFRRKAHPSVTRKGR